MGLKEKLFILFLIISITFPFFFSKKKIELKEIELPYISIKNGNFKSYKTILEREGNFDKLKYFNKSYFTAKNLYIKFIDKNNSLFAEKLIFRYRYNFYNTKYITPKYTYLAKKATYDEKTKTLKAKTFKFFNKKIDGYGDSMLYKNGILTAKNIVYFIKGIE